MAAHDIASAISLISHLDRFCDGDHNQNKKVHVTFALFPQEHSADAD
jgi:hypothetical protein